MLDVAGQPPCQLSPDDIDVPTTNVRPRVRLVRNSPYGKRAERLARYIMEQFSKGLDDEEALFESAFGRSSTSTLFGTRRTHREHSGSVAVLALPVIHDAGSSAELRELYALL